MSDNLGTRLREARLRRGLSLRSVAQTLGVSASLISQDELLGLPQTETRQSPKPLIPPDVQRAADNPIIEMENGVRWERLATAANGPADAILVTYAPGAASSIEGRLMRHAGLEYAYLLEGELTLQLDFETYVLHPGDSLQFDSVRPHMYANNGSTPAKGVWFVFGRRQHNSSLPDAPGAEASMVGSPASAVDVLRAMDDLDA
jgi:quercetin dioxygenase-like cupin family protein